MSYSIADGVENRVDVHREIDQQVVRIGMRFVQGTIKVCGHRGRRQCRVPHPKFIDIPSVVVASVSIASDMKADHLPEQVVFVGSRVPQGPIEVDGHSFRHYIFGKGPMVPFALVLVGTGRLIDAIVASLPPGIPVNAAIGPRQVNVYFALVTGVHAFANRVVLRLEFRRPAGPKLNRHSVFNGVDFLHRDLDSVVTIKMHIAPSSSSLPRLLGSRITHPIALPIGRIIQLHQHLNDEVAGAVPLQRSIQHKTSRSRGIRHLARCGYRPRVEVVKRIGLRPVEVPLHRIPCIHQRCHGRPFNAETRCAVPPHGFQFFRCPQPLHASAVTFPSEFR